MQKIFVAHSPFHVFISEMMVNTMDEFVNCKNILLLEFDQDVEDINRGLWFDVIYLENVGNSTLGRKNYQKSENNIGLVRKLVDENSKSCLFLSDIAWPMNNRLFFDKQLRRKAAFCLISDGLGTYLLPRVTNMLFLRGSVKYLNGLLRGGVRYRNYLGSQFGVDRKEIKYVYAPNVKFVECDPAKKKEVFTSTMKIPQLDQSKCILLDQPGLTLVNEKDWSIIQSATVDFLKSLGVDLYYKNHPSGRKEEEVYYQSHGFSIIEANGCAEKIIAEENFGIVVSYLSSALFNLKLQYSEAIRCIALSNRLLSTKRIDYNDNRFDEAYELFRKINIEVIEI